MAGEERDALLARIEAALNRIETVISFAPRADEALLRRHETLRGAVAAALQEIDGLIEEQEG